ncbi:protein-disulfide reductase [Rickettsia sp. MEAM1 (Bemisia tabaci)]|uniref:DsbA family protein n=1 Tax=unclassified Rickettsia TaxID=114295 RepID=UPI000303B899|nr:MULTISPECIES: DsbA family protein [unclassified Rickettsia]ASX27606.1 protein-disulfide reductase [Rickettsia sp. MEAM1 (Bemisia tabaci)]ODA38216.1 protein-disulfide reductase [Rickettsia sp. wb]ODA38664.1 protein-disulfide reductase [Rickettsia sp. wq]
MRNSFITLIFLLLLSGCSEEKVVEQESSESITPAQASTSDENNNLTTETTTPAVITPAVQEQIEQKPEVKTFKVTFKIDENDMVLGNKDSKIVVVEYFSPTCPHCAYYHSTIFPELKQKYIDTNKIAYVTREFIATKQDLDASILARCKGDLNSFMLFHDIMLKQQDKWSVSNKYRELLTDIGQLGGVTPEEYKKCLSDDKITETLIANTNFITKAPKFIGTPSFFVNGVQTENYSINSISAAIDKAIEESKNKIDL